MKKALVLLSLLGFAAPVFANAEDYIHCQNGDPAKLGDAYYAINIYEDGLDFRPYEGSFAIEGADAKYANGVFTIKNVKTELTVEGDKSSILVNGTVQLSKDDTKLVVKISINKGAYRTYKMSCVKLSP